MKDRIKKIRHDAGMTQKAFAEAVGVKPIIVSHWETGASQPGKARLYVIAAKFNVDLDWLQTGEGEMRKPPKPETPASKAADVETIKTLFAALPEYWQKAVIDAAKEMIETGETFPRSLINKIDISGVLNGNVEINQNNENRKGGKNDK